MGFTINNRNFTNKQNWPGMIWDMGLSRNLQPISVQLERADGDQLWESFRNQSLKTSDFGSESPMVWLVQITADVGQETFGYNRVNYKTTRRDWWMIWMRVFLLVFKSSRHRERRALSRVSRLRPQFGSTWLKSRAFLPLLNLLRPTSKRSRTVLENWVTPKSQNLFLGN